MAIRLSDIARDLNVSAVTVSKALRDCSDISAETKKRVLKRIKELNYRPNRAARALATGRTFAMGLVVPGLVHGFFAEIAQGIATTIRRKAYSLSIATSEEDADLEKQEIDHMLANGLDCLIIASVQWTVESFRRIEELGIPYVLIDRRFVGLQANFVGVDDQEVGLVATGHLYDQGCRRIAHISGPEVSTSIDRLEGYRRALVQRGLPVLPELIVTSGTGDSSGIAGGFRAMRQLLERTPRPDAVFCHNDTIATGAMKAITQAGLRIPRDVAVIGCGNLQYADLLAVSLTSIDQGATTIGDKASRLAFQLIGAKSALRPKNILIRPKLIPRASTNKAAG
jgi:LacI family transcriptional regulator